MPDYSYSELLAAYKNVGVRSGRVVYVTGNFGRLGRYQTTDKMLLLQGHLDAIRELIGPDGTLVVPTHSWSLCNTDIPFDPEQTASETGPFTEFVRALPGAVRQFHPFSSSTALGRDALAICADTSRHVYGPESPFQRLIDRDALYVSVGQPMERSISLVHHIELVMGVPYRYSKEFFHPCRIGGSLGYENFYVYVTRSGCPIERDGNVKIMNEYRNRGFSRKVPLGRSFMEAVSCREFYDLITKYFSRDIYAWLRSPPSDRSACRR